MRRLARLLAFTGHGRRSGPLACRALRPPALRRAVATAPQTIAVLLSGQEAGGGSKFSLHAAVGVAALSGGAAACAASDDEQASPPRRDDFAARWAANPIIAGDSVLGTINGVDCSKATKAVFGVQFTKPYVKLDVGQKATGWFVTEVPFGVFSGEHFSDVRNRLGCHVAQAHVIGLAIGEHGDDADHLPQLEKDLVQTVARATYKYKTEDHNLIGRLVNSQTLIIYKGEEILTSIDVQRPPRSEDPATTGLPEPIPIDKAELVRNATWFCDVGAVQDWVKMLQLLAAQKAADVIRDAAEKAQTLAAREAVRAAAMEEDKPGTGLEVVFAEMKGGTTKIERFPKLGELQDLAARGGFAELEFDGKANSRVTSVWWQYPRNRIVVVPDTTRFDEKVPYGSAWTHAAYSGRVIYAKAFVELGKLAEAWGWVEDIDAWLDSKSIFMPNPENPDRVNMGYQGKPLSTLNPAVEQPPPPTTYTAGHGVVLPRREPSARTRKGTHSRS